MEIPVMMRELISSRVRDDFSSEICNRCNSNCCSGSGFGLLENVLEIYKKYLEGGLRRENYTFEAGLDPSKFIYKYFDRVLMNGSLLVFFPKTIKPNGELLSVPPWNYYNARDYLKNRVEMNMGCIFLNKNLSQNMNTGHKCILHNTNYEREITCKPIDCIFLTCTSDMRVINPTPRETNLWFAMLDYYFPNSSERFKQLCPSLPD